MPKWSQSAMKDAVAKVRAKELSMNRANKLYGIPVETLHRHVHHAACSPRPGRPTITEEREIAYVCQVSNVGKLCEYIL